MVTAKDIETWCGHRCVDFHYGHIALMDVKDKARELGAAMPDYLRYMERTTAGTPAFTIIDQGKVALSFGVFPIWPGLGEGWMVPSNHIDGRAIALIKGARIVFNKIGTAMQLRRLQFMVRSSHLQATRFAEALYFDKEATLKAYGPEGDDYYVYVRFYDGRNHIKAKDA